MIDNQQPVLVLEETAYGVQAVGGDPRYIEALGLNQFRTLKDIADYVNGAGQGFQAVFDEESQNESQQEEPSLDDQLAPALNILKEMMSRVQQRQAKEQAQKESKKPEAEMLQDPNTQVIQGEQGHIYVSIDGDNIGNKVAQAEELDDEKTLAEISARINAGQQVLDQFARKMGGKVIEAGGDEGLIKIPAAAKDYIEELREEYRNVVGATCTVGVGKKISESTKARMLGKLTGKNKVVVFDESTAKELELRLQQNEGGETRKMQVAMRGADSMVNQPPQAQPQQQEEKKPEEADARYEDNPELAQLSPDLLKKMDEVPAGNRPQEDALASRDYDSQIENDDYSESDNPEFSKQLRYMARYGKGEQ